MFHTTVILFFFRHHAITGKWSDSFFLFWDFDLKKAGRKNENAFLHMMKISICFQQFLAIRVIMVIIFCTHLNHFRAQCSGTVINTVVFWIRSKLPFSIKIEHVLEKFY